VFETLKNEKDNNSKDLYSRKDRNLVLSRVARFYATTEQKLIHSFCNALRMETIHPFPPQVASLYQRWLGKRMFSDKRL
jgi:acetone carboxylase gamma subunit